MSDISTLITNEIRDTLENLSRKGVGFINLETTDAIQYQIDNRIFDITVKEQDRWNARSMAERRMYLKKVIFVSVDKPERWSQWSSTVYRDDVYYSDFLSTESEVNNFIERIKNDYPDSNLIDNKGGHEYFIKYVILNYDENDTEGFETLRRMMRAYNSYNNRK